MVYLSNVDKGLFQAGKLIIPIWKIMSRWRLLLPNVAILVVMVTWDKDPIVCNITSRNILNSQWKISLQREGCRIYPHVEFTDHCSINAQIGNDAIVCKRCCFCFRSNINAPLSWKPPPLPQIPEMKISHKLWLQIWVGWCLSVHGGGCYLWSHFLSVGWGWVSLVPGHFQGVGMSRGWVHTSPRTRDIRKGGG